VTIKELCKKAHSMAKKKGFWDIETEIDNELKTSIYLSEEEIVKYRKNINQAFITQKLMLIVSELGEAVEALRNCNKENFEEEIADVFIRLGDFCGGYNIDIEKAIKKKMTVNEKRPYKHGKQF